jgi:GT2 family glycosyltransferase
MGGNFSINRRLALDLGGFDENFVHVAYRFEAEFAERVLATGRRIFFEPDASIRHLKAERGGTRSYGHHLTTIRPSHSVGAYYFLLRSNKVSRRLLNLLRRPFRAIRTKHHATHPWWIPVTLASEGMGLVWAVFLYFRGPRLLNSTRHTAVTHD